MNLRYRAGVAVEELAVGECTVRGATRAGDGGARWWMLWLHVQRDSDGQPDVFAVPVIPNGSYTEAGPGGRSWGLTPRGNGFWQVAPSINVLSDEDARRAVAGLAPTGISLWHQTPGLFDVPDGEPWTVT